MHHEEALQPSAALSKIGDALPGLGIVAAVLGVVITMGHIDAPPAEEIGHHVGAALVGTFLGILLSYGFVAAAGAEPRAARRRRAVLLPLHQGRPAGGLQGQPAGDCRGVRAARAAARRAAVVQRDRAVLPRGDRRRRARPRKRQAARSRPMSKGPAGHHRQEEGPRRPRPPWRRVEGGLRRLRHGDDGVLPRHVDRRAEPE